MFTSLKRKSCTPCTKGTPPLSESAENELLGKVVSWSADRSGAHKIKKRFLFNSFIEALGFVKTIAMVAEDEGHHPAIRIDYRWVTVEFTTHAIRGLSENDFIMAAKFDNVYSLVTQDQEGVLKPAMA